MKERFKQLIDSGHTIDEAIDILDLEYQELLLLLHTYKCKAENYGNFYAAYYGK